VEIDEKYVNAFKDREAFTQQAGEIARWIWYLTGYFRGG
jgi:hypothetical protein